MKRAGGLWPSVVAFCNLRAAALRAARGKRRNASTARFLADLEPELLRLQRELRTDRWRPGRAFRFDICDPKRRTISAAPFRDRVLHQALIATLEPVFERRMIHASFACRRGKGTHAALVHARGLVQRQRWFLKLDIARCFDSLRHATVLETLARTVKDRRVLALCDRIVSPVSRPRGGRPSVGLPIGNLTSQWFANLVLDRLDHWALEVAGVSGYVRYMDDFAFFGDGKRELARLHGRVDEFLATRLQLRLKQRATILAPVEQGLPFLGWRVYRGGLRLRPSNLRRSRARLRHRLWEQRQGRIDVDQLAASVRSICEHLRQGNTLSLRRTWFAGPEGLHRLHAPHSCRAPP